MKKALLYLCQYKQASEFYYFLWIDEGSRNSFNWELVDKILMQALSIVTQGFVMRFVTKGPAFEISSKPLTHRKVEKAHNALEAIREMCPKPAAILRAHNR